ncbi:uncharacterized protein LOC131237952 isoform X2 [Magnolia sinica]|uniref:uncharacterized protein LOC131237952 isoform X2 n=1 Tax=Magnolia sinica TaxID=86752 RepID=UPI00265A33EF|nr:uncharacterized protein LOC131237952 isoform X2 [Magnolia sinica]
MPMMRNASRYNRAQAHSSLKQRRSGYEPSDAESEWRESPWDDLKKDSNQRGRVLVAEPLKTALRSARSISPLGHDQRYAAKPDHDFSFPIKASEVSPIPRSKSISPYRPHVDDGGSILPKLGSHLGANGTHFAVSENQRHISSFEVGKEEPYVENDELKGSYWKPNQKSPHKFMDSGKASRMSERSNYSHRSMSTPKLRAREKVQHTSIVSKEQRWDRSPSPLAGIPVQKQKKSSHTKAPSASEINEMIANEKLSKSAVPDALMMESTDSIPQGDIFFSRDFTALHKDAVPKNIGSGSSFAPKAKAVSERISNVQQTSRGISGFDQNMQVSAVSTVPSQRNMFSSSAMSRQSCSKTSDGSSKMADGSRVMSESFRKFTASIQRSQKDMWFSCVRGGACGNSKSPETRNIDEASFIERAFVVENLRQFWADKHRPDSLSGFICNKSQAQHLKQLISLHNCPHLLFRGPSGSGKKALGMALLWEIFGASAWQISNDLRYFHVQETQQMPVVVPLTSSPHHVELNLKSISKNARYALMALVKEITSNRAPIPEFSDASLKADYKDACKIILCCEDDTGLLESIKSRCKLITVDAPVTHEIMEVLIQIARKENFDLPMSFAAKIATKSKQNLRNAIMALEACKAHNYPFTDEQPIPLGWEELLVELAAEILADPSPKRLPFVRGKFQRLLVDIVHPKLILQKLVEQFLRGVEASLKRELYYWHAYYDKRLPSGTGALLKLEEFVAKFMSIYGKGFSGSGRLQCK